MANQASTFPMLNPIRYVDLFNSTRFDFLSQLLLFIREIIEDVRFLRGSEILRNFQIKIIRSLRRVVYNYGTTWIGFGTRGKLSIQRIMAA